MSSLQLPKSVSAHTEQFIGSQDTLLDRFGAADLLLEDRNPTIPLCCVDPWGWVEVEYTRQAWSVGLSDQYRWCVYYGDTSRTPSSDGYLPSYLHCQNMPDSRGNPAFIVSDSVLFPELNVMPDLGTEWWGSRASEYTSDSVPLSPTDDNPCRHASARACIDTCPCLRDPGTGSAFLSHVARMTVENHVFRSRIPGEPRANQEQACVNQPTAPMSPCGWGARSCCKPGFASSAYLSHRYLLAHKTPRPCPSPCGDLWVKARRIV
ncbi:hypothetical protein F4782DRAFT_481231 [Xylaria castorea]|nr:hypothetical protein F4782DRAFT_481231 [Xylaria castorea]